MADQSSSSVSGGFDPVEMLSASVADAIRGAFPGSFGEDEAIDPLLGESKQRQFGDFQSNAAMPLAKSLGRPPREVALAIVERLASDARVTSLCVTPDASSIAGPGFINFRIREEALAGLVSRLDGPGLGVPPPSAPRTIVVDLCGVNLAKQMHVGHLRSTIIGDAIARVLERLGHRVIRQSHVGDWGLPIAMVTAALRDGAASGRLDPARIDLSELDRLYRRAQRDCTPDRRGLEAARRWDLGPKAIAELEAQVAGAEERLADARRTLVLLQSRDPATVAVWQRIYDVTMSACIETCARLHAEVKAEHSAGESSYADDLPAVVEDLGARGVAEVSDGAMVVRVDGVREPCLIRKSDGGFLYATTDLAAIRHRVRRFGADRVIYCVDSRQSLHFRQVFGAAVRAGYARRDEASEDAVLEHAAFGNVLGEDGRPLKTRSGENVRLAALIAEGVDRARRVLDAKLAERGAEMGDDERRRVAEALGITAIKYADLSNDRIRDYVFSFDRMVAFEGDTGPYLLFALVRIKSIYREAPSRGVTPDPDAAVRIGAPEEKDLALALLRYPSVLGQVAAHLEPHRLCNYLYALAGAFSSFYNACQVLGAPDEPTRQSRLRLCRLTERILEDGLATLGLPTVDRM